MQTGVREGAVLYPKKDDPGAAAEGCRRRADALSVPRPRRLRRSGNYSCSTAGAHAMWKRKARVDILEVFLTEVSTRRTLLDVFSSLAFRLHTAPIAHSAPHCRLRILKGGRESFECTCVLVFMRTRPLVHVSSIFGPGSGRPKSWYDRGLIRFIILTLSARYSPGILAFLSDSGGNKCPSWRWHCRQGHH